MDKKIPGVFANKLESDISHNDRVFYSSGKNVEMDVEKPKEAAPKSITQLSEKNVVQKVNDIFNSPKYVYKADVDITLKSGVVTKKIIGKNATHLISMENELIPLTDIVDISFMNDN